MKKGGKADIRVKWLGSKGRNATQIEFERVMLTDDTTGAEVFKGDVEHADIEDGTPADPAQKIAQELKELAESLTTDKEFHAAEGGGAEGVDEEGFVKSADLVAIEDALEKQREEKRAFEERLRGEREALDKLTEELEESDTAQMTVSATLSQVD